MEEDIIKYPTHLAIIMDGNGRWAKQKGKVRLFGHQNGTKAVRQSIEYCVEKGIRYLTLYAFSTENANRPKDEVEGLMNLLTDSLKKELPTMMKNNVRLWAIGKTDLLPENVRKELKEVIEKTADNTGTIVTLALQYGGREELLRCVKMIANKVNEGMPVEEITEKTIEQNLYTHDMPDVDLLIRTSGELRVSNFLLWQIAYSELYFVDVFWPDFDKTHLQCAIEEYNKRERRFGKTSEQIKK